jgi:mannitol operon transcriptional antiterminator
METIEQSLERVHRVSVSGSGIRLECGNSIRQELCALLDKEPLQPGNRRIRLVRLSLELLANSGTVQKLFYYSDNLGVSESTVSHDLDVLELLLNRHAISQIRRPGQGIYVEGKEDDIQAAICGTLILNAQGTGSPYSRALGYPGGTLNGGLKKPSGSTARTLTG